MTEIIRIRKHNVIVKVNGIKFDIPNEDVKEQLDFMEKVVPKEKNTFSFAKFFEPVPTLSLQS